MFPEWDSYISNQQVHRAGDSPHKGRILMKQTRLAMALLALLLLYSPGCNDELGPLNEPSGFRGVIRFKNWPSADSVRDLRLVTFETFPSDSAGILLALLGGRAAAFPAIGQKFPMFLDSLPYEFTTTTGTNLQVKNYEYIIIAQQFGPNILSDWQPAGVYTKTPDSFNPAAVRVLLHRVTQGIDIDVDFHHLPPKPWR